MAHSEVPKARSLVPQAPDPSARIPGSGKLVDRASRLAGKLGRLFLPGLLALACLFSFASPGEPSAKTYRWTDPDGTVHVSDQPPAEGFVVAPVPAPTPWQGPSAPVSRPRDGKEDERTWRFSRGLLWKVEPPAATAANRASPAYLFGTIHLSDPRVLNLAPEVRRAFDASATFCMEAILDLAAFLQVTQRMLYADGRNLETATGKELFDEIVPRMAERGVPGPILNQFKPWAVLMMMSVPKESTGVPLDLALQGSAAQAGKPVCALETIEEQIALFEAIPVPDQVRMLRETVKRDPLADALLRRMLERYLERDLEGLLLLARQEIDAASPENSAPARAFWKRMIDDRNSRMVQRMSAKLRAGNVFVAVGAAHLAGEKGILSLLEKQGYKVTVVY